MTNTADKATHRWCPIADAPRDGTNILLTDGKWIDIARWSDKCQHGRFEESPGWQIFDCEDGWYSVSFENPTHWMPLPDPPSSAVEDANAP